MAEKVLSLSRSRENTREAVLPAGTVYPFAGNTAPEGFLICDGSSLIRADFPELFANIGTAWGTASGTTFNLPDLRGKILRSVDSGAGNDPDAGSRTASGSGGNTGDNVGSIQSDAFQGHWHTLTGENGNIVATGNTNIMRGAGVPAQSSGAFVNNPISDGANGTPRISLETRMKNVNVNYIIKI